MPCGPRNVHLPTLVGQLSHVDFFPNRPHKMCVHMPNKLGKDIYTRESNEKCQLCVHTLFRRVAVKRKLLRKLLSAVVSQDYKDFPASAHPLTHYSEFVELYRPLVQKRA